MNDIENFLKKLSEIENKYNANNESKNDFNFFNVMFKGTEEVTLHSRFISYLLSIKEHNFLELFVRKILKIEKEKFNTNHCKVIPNEQDKSEYEEIDILIINENEKQAIIIENKIHAEPSIHEDMKIGSGYRGQLERYYNTITKGEDKNGKKCKYKCDEDKTYVYYLTLYKEPTDETIGELKEKGIFNSKEHKIDYYKIQEWLDLCIDKENDSFLNTIIKQYLNLIKKMTTDNKKALEITDLIAENERNWQSAFVFSEQIQNVKWHTIHRFFSELAEILKTQIPDEKLISEVAHHNKRAELKIVFDYNSTKLQIVNDDKGFTLGNLTKGTWGYFPEEIKKIKFCDFSNEETFHIINNDYRKIIIDEIMKYIEKKYENLNEAFY